MIPEEFFAKVEEAQGVQPITITCGKSIFGDPYWTIGGLGVSAGGYSSFLDCAMAWLGSLKTLENKEVSNA